MRTLLIMPFVLILNIYNMFGQENVLYSNIQQAKNSNMEFKPLSTAFSTASPEKNSAAQFVNPDEVSFLHYAASSDLRNNCKAVSLTIPVPAKYAQKGTVALTVELLEAPESFYDYEVVTSAGDVYPANRDIKHYRGIVKGEPNSMVAISFYEDEVMGGHCHGCG
jgi:hypothetical protein